MSATMIDHALALAARGFEVFPGSNKKPAIKGWQEAATREEQQIRRLWSGRNAESNIGISTTRFGDGEALIVVDVDRKPDRNGEDTLFRLDMEGFELPDTLEQETPRGGRHLIYRHREAVKQGTNVLGPAVDIRSKGGYIVAPGSTVDGKQYRITHDRPIAQAPDWLVAKCGRVDERPAPSNEPVANVDPDRARRRAIEYLRDEAPLAVEGDGGDDATYRVACRLKDMGLDEAAARTAMAEDWNDRCSPPWGDDELAEKVANAYRYGREPVGVDAPETQFKAVKADPTAPTKKPGRLSFVPFSEIKLEETAPALVNGVFDEGALSDLYGASGTGKTFFALDIAHHVATGAPWRGCGVSQGAVVYVAAENPGSIKRRILALKKRHRITADIPLAVVPCPVDLFHSQGDTAELVTLIREVGERYGRPVKLVVIDTAARAMAGADENSGKDMGQFIGHLDRIRTATAAHLMVVHHAGKDESKGARGHSGLRAAIDTELVVKDRIVEVTKQRDGETGARFAFDIERVVIGQDATGRLIDSAVLVHREVSEVRRLAAPTGHAAQVMNALRSAIADRGAPIPAASGMPATIRAVTVETWREAYLSATSDTAEKKTKCRRFERGGDMLATSGHIAKSHGYAWIPD